MGMLLLLLLPLDLMSSLEIEFVALILVRVSSHVGGLHDSSHI